jgi:predicted kinase
MSSSKQDDCDRRNPDAFYDCVDAIEKAGHADLSNKDMNATDHARQRRELLDMMNRLRALGYAFPFDYPPGTR